MVFFFFSFAFENLQFALLLKKNNYYIIGQKKK